MARRKKPMRLRSSPWTHLSLYVVILAALINATALIGFLLSFVQQAAYSGNTSRWNIVIIVALIAGVLATSLFLIIARIFAVRSVLRSIPKPYIPVKTIDVPKVRHTRLVMRRSKTLILALKEIASYIQTEYTRTALVAHLSQPNATKQEGWGHPSRFRCVPRDLEEADTAIAASPLAGVHFRSTMRSSFWVLCESPSLWVADQRLTNLPLVVSIRARFSTSLAGYTQPRLPSRLDQAHPSSSLFAKITAGSKLGSILPRVAG